jgi:glycosyltransferase involved in cell wall biosynthesis
MAVTDSTGGGGERASISHTGNSISVVIPAYNAAKYLPESLNSVLSQTLPPDEILVIDDGSTDDTVAVASAFPGVRVASYENAGPSAGRNRGMALATGDWVAFLDHDDLWLPQKLEKQMRMLNSHPEADVCVTGSQLFQDVDGKRLFTEPTIPPPSEKLGRSLYGETRLCPSFVIVRRSMLRTVGDFETKQRKAEDWDYWLRLEQAGARFVSCPEVLGLYRVHAANASKGAWLMYEGEMETYERRIAPGIHPILRPFRRLSVKSRFLAGISLEERPQGRPHLRIMLRSIFTWPFGRWYRYTIAFYMLMQKMGLMPRSL